MRLALLSNVTVEVLAAMLRKEHDVWLAPGFGAWAETCLAPPPELAVFDPDAVVFVLDAARGAVDAGVLAQAEAALAAALPRAARVRVDVAAVAEETGRAAFYDERMWRLASMPWSLAGLRALQREVAGLVAGACGPRRKVLALDFDNTLWKGVVGEDGADGVEPFVAFQRGVRALRARGVLLVGLSKNNAADVEPMWRDARMALGREDFVDIRLGWEEKSVNLDACARTLNLGREAFVFVDDNAAERALMRARLPEVAVPEFPVTAAQLARWYFPAGAVTDEDRARTAQYHAEARRRAFGAGLDVETYLKGLEIWTDVHEMRAEEIARVAQLSRKTNQFNVRTNRYTEAEVRAFLEDPARLVVTARAGDRFGDQGLVAFVHVRDGEIVDWVMSCRAMNRRIEFAVQRRVEELLRARGVETLRASYIPTPKNAPVRNLFDAFGFTLERETPEEKRYTKRLGQSALSERGRDR